MASAPPSDSGQDDASGVQSEYRDQTGPHYQRGSKMSDKSPRQGLAKKSGKSLKEKRADKRAKGDNTSQAESVLNKKR